MIEAITIDDRDVVIIVPGYPTTPASGYMMNPVQDYTSANTLADAIRRRFPLAEIVILQSMPDVAVMGGDVVSRSERTRDAIDELQKVKERLS